MATGGLAGLIVPLSRQIEEYEPTLTLDGLRMIHDMNTAPGRGR